MLPENSTLRGGMLYLLVNGERHDAKGDFTYGLGRPKKAAIVGADGVHGFFTEAQVAFFEGAITDSKTLDVAAFQDIVDATATLELQNGKVIVFRQAAYVDEGAINPKEGEIPVRFEALSAEEVR
jgi:hypothetical protein